MARNRHNPNTSQQNSIGSRPNRTLEERLEALERAVSELSQRTTLAGNLPAKPSGDGSIVAFLDKAYQIITLVIILVFIFSK